MIGRVLFRAHDSLQWRFGPLLYTRVGSVLWIEIGELLFVKVGRKWMLSWRCRYS